MPEVIQTGKRNAYNALQNKNIKRRRYVVEEELVSSFDQTTVAKVM